MFKKLFILLTSALLLSAYHTGPGEDTNAKIKAVFIYNFTKYIEWPKNYKEGNFVISIVGNSSGLLSELDNMARTKTIGSQKLEIKNLSSMDGLPNKCHILYIPNSSDVKLNELPAKLKGKNTLVITEKAGSTKQGSAINFIAQDNKQKFELNKSNAEKYELKVSSTLQSLAVASE